MLVKICGATRLSEIALLADAGADLVGLWHGVHGGPAELDADRVCRLAASARASGRLEPVLVTFLRAAEQLGAVLDRSAVTWVQLHGYQPPAFVRTLRSAMGRPLTVVKALHVRGADCAERGLIRAYERAGVDVFLLDVTTEDGRVGSTGRRLDDRVVDELVEATTRPFLLAGGISGDTRPENLAAVAHPRFLGIDVDTGARRADGRFTAQRVNAIVRAWRTPQRRIA
jgi:phosphoribosylanthranilate isomerase